MTTHYDVLGVKTNASADAIKRAYYKRARAYHPDAHAGSAPDLIDEAERAMAAVNMAWNVLRDPAERRKYDQTLIEANPKTAARSAKGKSTAPPMEILGAGFRYWMGGVGNGAMGGDGRRRISLAVDGATSLSALKSLGPDRLWSLHADHASIDDDELVNLQGMTDLLFLDLSYTRITDAGLLHLQGLDRLEVLHLWGTEITDAGLALLARLPNLVHLGLGKTKVSDAGISHFADMKRLKILQLWGTSVTGRGRRRLRSGLAGVKVD